MYITPDSKYIIVTYGMGCIYFILTAEKRLIKSFRLFPDITYEDDSFQSADLCCYYNEETQVDFSNTGRYAAIRVRGDYDPQESDGREHLFTPVYFRSIFVIDLFTLEICFEEDYSDAAESSRNRRNLASIAFSPKDDYLATGALGRPVKVFSLTTGACLGSFFSLVWVSDPCNIRSCSLITFLDDTHFIYVNNENDIIRVSMREDGNRKEYRQPLRFDLKFQALQRLLRLPRLLCLLRPFKPQIAASPVNATA